MRTPEFPDALTALDAAVTYARVFGKVRCASYRALTGMTLRALREGRPAPHYVNEFVRDYDALIVGLPNGYAVHVVDRGAVSALQLRVKCPRVFES